ncbi:MAG: hypothetical protein H6742_04860 [Alphaproteobacteria bacterium]|nr:hypothetical protein [Alphaproteobacteria bacterium]
MDGQRTVTVAVIGGGVAGLTSAAHLIELWAAARAERRSLPELRIRLVAPLVPTGGDGSGLGGKAMSRSFEGPADAHGNQRRTFFGPAMPHKGTVPHGYHVVWEYPNLRRFLGAGQADEPHPPLDGGLLRPAGGAGALAVFQGIVDDPSPGGPGIALMGLSDPRRPETATLPATRALYRLAGGPLGALVTQPFRALFRHVADGIDPLFFADLLFAREVDLEMRLSLVVSSLVARTTDPERKRVRIDGQDRALYDLEYGAWLHAELARWADALPGVLAGELSGWRAEVDALLRTLRAQLTAEEQPDHEGLLERLLDRVAPRAAQTLDDLALVSSELLSLLDALPSAATRLASGRYPVARTLHLRFGPDATFTSPYSYDAASALRSLAFVFTSPRSARVQAADGARMHRLWVRLWQRLQDAAALHRVQLEIVPGRVSSLTQDADGVVVGHRAIRGHAFSRDSDLAYPHTHQLHPWGGDPAPDDRFRVDVAIPAVAPAILHELLPPVAGADRAALAALAPHANATLELLIWTRERIEYAPFAHQGLATSSITGLEGGWCLLADYSQGLWSPESLAEEDPFGDGAFGGSVLESCGAFDDLFACPTRGDAYGWPAEVKQAVADAVASPALFSERDQRPWPLDDAGWRGRRAGGHHDPARAADPAFLDDWFVASRWMAWQFLRQLARCAALGPRAVRQFRHYETLLDPRGRSRAELLQPPPALLDELRFVVMINAKPRNRIFSPGVGTWTQRHVSGAPLTDLDAVFPAGDWTRNGCDVICMEAATLSGMRAARGAFRRATGQTAPESAPQPRRVMPHKSWYTSTDPLLRGHADEALARSELGILPHEPQ